VVTQVFTDVPTLQLAVCATTKKWEAIVAILNADRATLKVHQVTRVRASSDFSLCGS
jgi:hypothetical protein